MKRNQYFACAIALTSVAMLAACGRVITRATPTTAPAAISLAITPLATLRPTATPAPYTPLPTATPTVTPTPVIYAVARGDTLLAIANRFGVTVAAIQDANGIDDPRALRVGQELMIPPKIVAGNAATAEPEIALPTPLPFRVENLFFADTPQGGLWCFGEVVNETSEPLEQVVIKISLLDSENQPLAQVQGGPATDFVLANGRAPFALLVANAPASFANYLVEPVSAVPAYLGSAYFDLEIRNVTGRMERLGTYQINGEVHNTGAQEAVEISTVATLYDAQGRVIGVRLGAPVGGSVPPGGQAAFEIDLVPAINAVARFEVTTQARRAK